eukprot:CAMPEP_0177409354 /NCGR_PEP_ID=MMETSP0368-20130122/64202_1 /TAXON_ID=447022 ORGANISM="Scrippsiella hangoei-like, Strain SHHI-4" /NCGR_SAMPLE_ID=MMETSP0368 /ASSEMBLY_ACC=CAM_ASM_000363 /LENGTH=310 /DNA_ID=CAMNT_0018878123 /DNA_START=26 /DNA_END=955 /DNA_ORIENTATION=+
MPSDPIIVGYHKIRGLGAPLRMICYYKGEKFINAGYGADMKEKWFGEVKPADMKEKFINAGYGADMKEKFINAGYGADMKEKFINAGYGADMKEKFINAGYGADMKEKWFGEVKPTLAKKNSCINLPYIVDGDDVITQSNTCALYLGRKLGTDTDANFAKNHTVLDQTMDLRNDLMKVVYSFSGVVKTKEEFPEGAKQHIAGTTTANFTKLEGFCVGPYMCGAKPESGDFMLFEMLDQHSSICKSIGEPDILDSFPKLKALHAAMKAEPTLASYFASDCYVKWAQNNGLFTHFTGQGADFEYGPSVEELV